MAAITTKPPALAPALAPVLEQMRTSARRGIDWILAQQRADGSFCDPADGVGAYYKVPSALAVAGEWRAAHRLLRWVADHHLTAAGDFRAPERKAHEPVHESWPAYANAWLIQGAQRVGRWDLARQGMAFLTTLELPGGGYYALDGTTPFLEPVGVAWGGLAALSTGHTAAAQRAGDRLVGLVDQQPDPQRFYYRMDSNGQLRTDLPAGAAALTYCVDASQTKQIYYNPGISLIFLTQLYQATADARYLAASGTILAFTQRCAADVHRFPPSGKLGLGCALYYALTGDEVARQGALNVATYLIETQGADGAWRLPNEEPYASLKNRESFDVLLDVTAEFSVFLLEMQARL